MKRWQQRQLTFRARGGRRPGAGRKSRRLRTGVPHRARPDHKKTHPVHVTLRASPRLPSFRREVLFREIRHALGRTARAWFRLVHFSVQKDHLHLLVEADDKSSLSRGVRGLTIRLARAVNRVLGRTGRVWDDRFHSRALPSPREVRNALVYVSASAPGDVASTNGMEKARSHRSDRTTWRQRLIAVRAICLNRRSVRTAHAYEGDSNGLLESRCHMRCRQSLEFAEVRARRFVWNDVARAAGASLPRDFERAGGSQMLRFPPWVAFGLSNDKTDNRRQDRA